MTATYTSRALVPSRELQGTQGRSQEGKKENATWKLTVVTKALRERSNLPRPRVWRSATHVPGSLAPWVSPRVAGGPR